MNIRNLKIIGIHKGYLDDKDLNIGTSLKYPINEFIIQYKDYIESINELPMTFSIGINANIKKDELNINNFKKLNIELENAVKKEKEKNKDLEEQINKLKILFR